MDAKKNHDADQKNRGNDSIDSSSNHPSYNAAEEDESSYDLKAIPWKRATLGLGLSVDVDHLSRMLF